MTCMLQDNVARHRDAKGKGDVKGTKLACRKAMCLGTRVPKATQTLHVCKAMCLGTGVPKVTQGVARHGGTEGDAKLGCHKAM
ncbi:unnamed protein product [Prunus armeniaca]